MARVLAVLKAMLRAARRGVASAGTLTSNNFFFVSAILLQKAGVFLYLLAGLILLVPLTGGPLRKVPRERLLLFPLARLERRALAMLAVWTNPANWLIAFLTVWGLSHKGGGTTAAFAAGLLIIGVFFPTESIGGFVRLRLPWPRPGLLSLLALKSLREMTSSLDFYLAAALALGGVAVRWFAPTRFPDVRLPLTLLTVLALSGLAQALNGFEDSSSRERYRLLPLHGWKILAAKDLAFLTIGLLLTLPLSPYAGLGAVIVALAVGNWISVTAPKEQIRWRFTSGAGIFPGILHTIAFCSAGVAADKYGPLVLLPAALALAVSLWLSARKQVARFAGP